MKTNFKNKRAFTLIELLIVIAIIGILFIVLVSKVDFATDKAKASGVQTDFRSFQTAFEQVAREHSGFATLGWDTGDDNGDRIRNSYDKGDNGAGGGIAQNGIQDGAEVFVGSKTYGENWEGVFTLVNPDNSKDASAFVALENAINANLDPKLHITLTPNADASGNLTGSATITMANQARDPWKNEYAGAYISNATVDKLDRGSIIMYSTGANGNLGVNYSVSGGLVGVEVPGSNVNGKDDYVLSVTYSYANGYGEVQTGTAGFSNNQSTLTSTPIVDNGVNAGGMSAGVGSVPGGSGGQTPSEPSEPAGPGEGGYQMLSGATTSTTVAGPTILKSAADVGKFQKVTLNGVEVSRSNYVVLNGSTEIKFLGEYINRLSDGTYEVEIHSTDGTAKATLIINIACREHTTDDEHEYECSTCGISYCYFYNCSSTEGCYCDWCGCDMDSTAYGSSHYDSDRDGYCDTCMLVWCENAASGYGNGYGPCHDDNRDHKCDRCGYEAHYDNNKDCKCDYCAVSAVHYDKNHDGICDNCLTQGVTVYHIDLNEIDGYCDVCGKVYHDDTYGSGNLCHDDNSNCYCDWCGWTESYYHYDSEPDGFCNGCGIIFCGGNHPDNNGDCRCDDSDSCGVSVHVDANQNGMCDVCDGKICVDNVWEGICVPNEYCMCYYCEDELHEYYTGNDECCLRCGTYLCADGHACQLSTACSCLWCENSSHAWSDGGYCEHCYITYCEVNGHNYVNNYCDQCEWYRCYYEGCIDTEHDNCCDWCGEFYATCSDDNPPYDERCDKCGDPLCYVYGSSDSDYDEECDICGGSTSEH